MLILIGLYMQNYRLIYKYCNKVITLMSTFVSFVIKRKLLCTNVTRHFHSFAILKKASDLIPSKPVWKHTEEFDLPPATKISLSLAHHLEQLSLVNFEDTNAVKVLESAIRFADQILLVDTDGVEPLVTLLEDIPLPLRSDDAIDTDPNIVKLSDKVFEDYYVAPIGNIPYTSEAIPEPDDDNNSVIKE